MRATGSRELREPRRAAPSLKSSGSPDFVSWNSYGQRATRGPRVELCSLPMSVRYGSALDPGGSVAVAVLRSPPARRISLATPPHIEEKPPRHRVGVCGHGRNTRGAASECLAARLSSGGGFRIQFLAAFARDRLAPHPPPHSRVQIREGRGADRCGDRRVEALEFRSRGSGPRLAGRARSRARSSRSFNGGGSRSRPAESRRTERVQQSGDRCISLCDTVRG